MRQKLISACLMLVLFYGLPLVAKLHLLFHPQMLTIILAALVVWFTQPAISPLEARSNQNSDRNSVWVIMALSALSAAAPVVEWAYFGTAAAHPAALAGGLSLMTGGIALRIWAIRVLGRFFTSTVRVQDGQRVITQGPYRWVRHPSYLGAYLAFTGGALFLQAWAGLAVALLAMGLAYRIRIDVEERELLRVFGAEYAAYRQRSWRMAPGLW